MAAMNGIAHYPVHTFNASSVVSSSKVRGDARQRGNRSAHINPFVGIFSCIAVISAETCHISSVKTGRNSVFVSVVLLFPCSLNKSTCNAYGTEYLLECAAYQQMIYLHCDVYRIVMAAPSCSCRFGMIMTCGFSDIYGAELYDSLAFGHDVEARVLQVIHFHGVYICG